MSAKYPRGNSLTFAVDDEGAAGNGVKDDYAAVANAIAKASAVANAGGYGIVEFNPTRKYLLGALGATNGNGLALPAGTPGGLIFRGNDCTVKLSADTPRFLDFRYATDYQTWNNVLVDGFNIDGGGISPIGNNHVIIGHYLGQGGLGQGQRQNFDNIAVFNCRTFNVVALDKRKAIWLNSVHLLGDETQTNVTRIHCKGLDLFGGVAGVVASGSLSSVNNIRGNIYLDDIYVEDVKWDSGGIPTVFQASSGVQIGSRSWGGRCTARHIWVRGAADVGLELDGFREIVAENTYSEDCFNTGFYITNYTNRVPLEDMTYTITDAVVNRKLRAGGTGFNVAQGGDYNDPNAARTQVGTLNLTRCKSIYDNPTPISSSNDGFLMLSPPRRLNMRDCQDEYRGWTKSTTGIAAYIAFEIQQGSVPSTARSEINISDFTSYVRGTGTAGQPTVKGARINTGTIQTRLEVDGLHADHRVDGVGASSGRQFVLDITGGTYRKAVLKGVQAVEQSSDDTNPRGLYIAAAVVIDDYLEVDDCDFSQMPAGTDILIDSANQGKVRAQRTRYRVAPTPGAVTLTAGAYTHIGPWPVRIAVYGTPTSVSVALKGGTAQQVSDGRWSGLLNPGETLTVVGTATVTQVPVL